MQLSPVASYCSPWRFLFALLAPCSWCTEELRILGFLKTPPIYVQRCLLLPTRASYPRAYIISTQLAQLNAAQSSLTEFCWIEVKREMNMIALRSRLERKEVTDPRRQYLLPAPPFLLHFHHRSSTACIAGTRISSWAFGLEICVFSLIYLVGFAWIF